MSHSQYHSHQCIAVAASTGQRCRLRTARGRKCWHHTQRDENLRVKRSTVPNAGLGLFVARDRVRKGERITQYTGEDLTKAQVQQRYGERTGQYVYCASKNKCKDARRTDERGLGRWANAPRGTGKRANAKLTTGNNLKAKRNIQPGQEVLVSYGRDYWK